VHEHFVGHLLPSCYCPIAMMIAEMLRKSGLTFLFLCLVVPHAAAFDMSSNQNVSLILLPIDRDR
jgi:hypothetical protein